LNGPHVDGSIVEFVGYAARASTHDKTGRIMPFVIQNVFILLGPAFFAASIYMHFGRIVRSVKGEKHGVNLLTKSFVLCDILSFVVQGSAAGLIVTSTDAKLGEAIAVAGLLVQIIMFGPPQSISRFAWGGIRHRRLTVPSCSGNEACTCCMGSAA